MIMAREYRRPRSRHCCFARLNVSIAPRRIQTLDSRPAQLMWTQRSTRCCRRGAKGRIAPLCPGGRHRQRPDKIGPYQRTI